MTTSFHGLFFELHSDIGDVLAPWVVWAMVTNLQRKFQAGPAMAMNSLSPEEAIYPLWLGLGPAQGIPLLSLPTSP